MRYYLIWNKQGAVLGVYGGEDETDAVRALHMDAGYSGEDLEYLMSKWDEQDHNGLEGLAIEEVMPAGQVRDPDSTWYKTEDGYHIDCTGMYEIETYGELPRRKPVPR